MRSTTNRRGWPSGAAKCAHALFQGGSSAKAHRRAGIRLSCFEPALRPGGESFPLESYFCRRPVWVRRELRRPYLLASPDCHDIMQSVSEPFMTDEHRAPHLRMRKQLCAFVVATVMAAGAMPNGGAATFIFSNANTSGAGSLQQAILDANANAGLDTIPFQIPGGGVHYPNQRIAFHYRPRGD